MMDVVVRNSLGFLKLVAIEDQSLLVRRDAFHCKVSYVSDLMTFPFKPTCGIGKH